MDVCWNCTIFSWTAACLHQKKKKREEDKNERGIICNMSTVDVPCLIFNSRVGDYAFDEVSFSHKWKCCLFYLFLQVGNLICLHAYMIGPL